MTNRYIDCHVHLWDLANKINQWIKPNSKLYQNQLIPDYLNSGFIGDKLVIIEAASSQYSINELEWLTKQLTNTNIKVRYISYIDLLTNKNEFEQQLARFTHFKPSLVGFRNLLAYKHNSAYSPASNDFTQSLDLINQFCENCHILDTNKYILELQLYPQQLKQIQNQLVDLPIQIVLEHCGLPEMDSLDDWLDMLSIINQSPNLYLKVSGLDINNNLSQTPKIISYINQNVCSSKIILGSNYPFLNNQDFLQMLDLFNKEQLEDIYQNSCLLYKLN